MTKMSTLEQRHATLDRVIADRQKSPSANDLEIATLKKQKLALKDRLEKS